MSKATAWLTLLAVASLLVACDARRILDSDDDNSSSDSDNVELKDGELNIRTMDLINEGGKRFRGFATVEKRATPLPDTGDYNLVIDQPGAGDQVFTLVPSSGDPNRVQIKSSNGLCVDICNGPACDKYSDADTRQVIMFRCTGTANQLWAISSSDGRITGPESTFLGIEPGCLAWCDKTKRDCPFGLDVIHVPCAGGQDELKADFDDVDDD